MSQSRENVQTDGRMDGQTLFYRILPADARAPITSLQQVTDGNTPNLVLKRMLRYFLKMPPSRKSCNFKTKIRLQNLYKKETSNFKLQTRNFKLEIKPVIENLQDKLYQLSRKQTNKMG